MRAHGKKYRKAAESREISSSYQPKQALEIIKTKAFAKFDETVDVAIRLGVDPRHADQIVRGTVVLPAGSGKTVRVLVIAVGTNMGQGMNAKQFKGAGDKEEKAAAFSEKSMISLALNPNEAQYLALAMKPLMK